MTVNIITRSIRNFFLLFLLLSSHTKGNNNELFDLEGEIEEVEEERELHRGYRPRSNGYSNKCRDRKGTLYRGAPCIQIPVGGRNLKKRNKKKKQRWYRGYWNGRTYRTQCKSYTCADVDCDSDIGRIQCPQTCGWCTTVWDELQANFTEFASFLQSVDLSYILQDARAQRTVFAPDNTTFTEFWAEDRVANYSDTDVWGEHAKDLAMYHIVRGRLLTEDINDGDNITTAACETIGFTGDPPTTINGDVNITDPDIELRNGVVHGIDAVLLPPSASMTIWEYLQDSQDHTTFFALLSDSETTDFQTILNDEGPYTVFAPTNDAFAEADLTNLTDNDIDNVLRYHIVEGNNLSYELYRAGSAETLFENNTLSFDARYFILYINYEFGIPDPSGAKTIEKNVLRSTGIIQVIDAVLIPPTDVE